MSILCDTDIRDLVVTEKLRVTPLPEHGAFQPASLDVRLGSFVLIANPQRNNPDPGWSRMRIPPTGIWLHPHQFMLAELLEHIEVPDFIAAQISGKSSLGRVGLQVHATAGFIDPGFRGYITLELCNWGPTAILLKPEQYIGQLVFTMLTAPCERPYGHPELGSHYQDQRGVTPASGVLQ